MEIELLPLATDGILVLVFYWVCKAVYNVYFHPLRKFPGPKRAVVGNFYEFYYDVIKDGTYLLEIKKMHEKYGPIVRITPDELHINDGDFYNQIYIGNTRRVDKYAPILSAFGTPTSGLTTVDHNLHRQRRNVLNPYFSKRAINALEPLLTKKIDHLCERLESYIQRDEPANLDAAFAALTADVVLTHSYGRDSDFIGTEDFNSHVKEAMRGTMDMYHTARFATFLLPIKNLPVFILRKISPKISCLADFRTMLTDEIKASFRDDPERKRESLMVTALRNPDLPPQERTLERMLDEMFSVNTAGTETTARTISVIMFHLLNNKSTLQKLREELSGLAQEIKRPYTHADLERLPYLTGVINEGLRLFPGVVIRLPRISPDEEIRYGDYTIPRGTPVSINPWIVHMNPEVFPNPHAFDPERWVRSAEEGTRLDRYLVGFSRGTRQCIGINLAYAELYLTVARIVMSFEMELVDTKPEDVEVYHFRMVGFPKEGLGQVQARVTKSLVSM